MKSPTNPCLPWLAAVLIATAANARAGDIYVIANGVPTLGAEEVKEIFLGEVQFSGVLKLMPVDNVGAQADFQERVLKMAANKYAAAWTKKAFRDGLNAPPVKGSDAEVIGFIKANPGAIGYVSAAPGPGVQVVGRY